MASGSQTGNSHAEPDDDERTGAGGGEIVLSPAEHCIRIHRWKVREGFQVTRNHIILLYTVVATPLPGGQTVGGPAAAPAAADLKRLKVAHTGVVRKRLFKDGDTVQRGTALLELGPCIHTTVIKDMCADCGADLRHEESIGMGSGGSTNTGSGSAATETASVPMIHSVPELKVTQQLAQKLGKADTRRLLEDRKLVLLVDLDQTIIHTTNDNVPNNVRDVYHFQLYGPHSPWYHTRMRPGTFRFLSRMAELFELHICTFGARNYAHKIAQFLDPDGKYFSHRILSRDECFSLMSKTDNLKALFPCGDSMVCIIDDREDVWNMASNLIQVKPYHFFQHTGDINAPPGMQKNELDGKEGVDFKDLLKKGKEAQAVTSKTDNSAKGATATSDGNQSEAEPVTKSDLSKPASPDNAAVDNNGDCPKKPDDNGKSTADSVKMAKAPASTSGADNMIDVEDPDDYLLYLETVLTHIHTRFYQQYDENSAIHDLKQLVPKIRGEILRGRTLVFSGLVPNQQRLEVSKAYVIARSLGATVKQQLTADTTHLVAATAGTFKVNAARKRPNEIQVVTPEWLWSCAERWECVEERLYPLDPLRPSKMRQPPPHCHSPEHATNYTDGDADLFRNSKRAEKGGRSGSAAGAGVSNKASAARTASTSKRGLNAGAGVVGGISDTDDDSNSCGPKFIDTINPLLKFTTDDLADMNQEFDQFFESDDEFTSDDNEPTDMENPPIDKKLKKRRRREEEKEQRSNLPKIFRTEAEELRAKLPTIVGASPRKKQRIRDVDEKPPVGCSDVRGDENNPEAMANASSSSSEREGIDYNDDEDDDGENAQHDDDDEMPSSRFRRGADLPSDLDMGSDCGSAASAEPADDEDDGDWNQMGAALEREFLGLE